MTASGSCSADRSRGSSEAREAFRHVLETIRRAFAEFLLIPTIAIAAFLLLAGLTYMLDEARIARAGSNSGLFGSKLFSDPASSSDLLGTIATSIITVTSITFSLLLIAVQQSAASLTTPVFDQFLRRRANQFYLGFFLGLALYCLVILATITPSHNPTYGVTLGFIMTVIALCMLVLLIYTTIDQMRPAMIIAAIHAHTLAARGRQLELLRNTRRLPRLKHPALASIAAETNGFLSQVNTSLLAKAAADSSREVEIIIFASIGDYISFRDIVAEIRTDRGADIEALKQAVLEALPLEDGRDLATDPAFGIEQLGMIGWTSASTAKSHPEPTLLACRSLRDILARWLDASDRCGGAGDTVDEPAPRIVYPDNVLDQLLKTFESLTVVASESMQHQTIAEVYRTFAAVLPRLAAPQQRQLGELIARSLSALGVSFP